MLLQFRRHVLGRNNHVQSLSLSSKTTVQSAVLLKNRKTIFEFVTLNDLSRIIPIKKCVGLQNCACK
jgi:hypothetical protein